MTTRLTQSTKNKIASVVETTFKAASNGSDATQALAKAASKAQLTKEQTKRACEAANVSLTLGHYKAHDGAEKAASFDTVDTDKVDNLMFPTSNVDAEVEKKPSGDGEVSEYDLGAYVKEETQIEDDIDMKEVCKEASVKIASALNSGELISRRIGETMAVLTSELDNELSKVAGMVNGLYGDSVNSIEDEAVKAIVSTRITKFASEKKASEQSRDLSESIEYIDYLLKEASAVTSAQEAFLGDLEEFKKQAAVEFGSPNLLPSIPLPGGRLANQMSNSIVGGFVGSRLRGGRKDIVGNYKYNPYDDNLLRDYMSSRDSLRSAVMMSELMNEDDVLKRAEPKDVIGAYNRTFGTDSSLNNSPELVRSALRQSIEYGGIDLPTMLSLEKERIKDTDNSTGARLDTLASGNRDQKSGKAGEFVSKMNDIDKKVSDRADKTKEVRDKRKEIKTKGKVTDSSNKKKHKSNMKEIEAGRKPKKDSK